MLLNSHISNINFLQAIHKDSLSIIMEKEITDLFYPDNNEDSFKDNSHLKLFFKDNTTDIVSVFEIIFRAKFVLDQLSADLWLDETLNMNQDIDGILLDISTMVSNIKEKQMEKK